jgi:hypothetical protein
VVVTFNMNASDFTNATITISYTSSDVAGMGQPYVLYKYNPDNNSYVALNGVVDTSAKTITVTLTSTNDPLFAIGGTAAAPTVMPTEEPTSISLVTWAWIVVGFECVTFAVLLVGLIYQQRSMTAKSKISK